MKSLLTISTLLLLAFTSDGQLTKKTWLVGGSGSFYSYNQAYSSPTSNITAKYTSIDISTSVGYFVIDKLAFGLTPTFSSFKGGVVSTASYSGGTTNGHQLAIGPFVRYYFLNKEKPFNILTVVDYQLGVNNSAAPPKSEGKFNKFSIMAGPEIFFNSSVGLEILLGYKATTQTINTSSPYWFSDTYKGFQISVGFQIHLEKL
jgi:hypothetical protein